MIPCAMTNIIINANGAVVFKGQGETTKRGLFISSISSKLYQQIEDNFTKTNFDSLKNNYVSGVSDQRTFTTTFVKNGKIFKTVYDYGDIAPESFRLAYGTLDSLYEKILLKNIPDPAFIPSFQNITESTLKKNGMALDIRQSETFLLMNYLRTGKISGDLFKPRFKLHTYFDIHPIYDIETDGRYYTFSVRGKLVTIDIGFNFYDVNAKNWLWRKATKYD
jgi:hypothetical protein